MDDNKIELRFPKALGLGADALMVEPGLLTDVFTALVRKDGRLKPIFSETGGVARARRFVAIFVNGVIIFNQDVRLVAGDRVELMMAIAGG